MLFFAHSFFLSLVCNMHNTYSTEVSAVEEGFVGDAPQHYHFYSFLYVFTNLLLIPSKVSTGLSDIFFFFFFFLGSVCFVLLIFLSLLNRFCELLSPPLFFDFWTLSFKKISVYFFLQMKWIKMDGFKTAQTKNSLLFDVFTCCGSFSNFCFRVRCNDRCKQIFFPPVTCCKPVSLKNACFWGGIRISN